MRKLLFSCILMTYGISVFAQNDDRPDLEAPGIVPGKEGFTAIKINPATAVKNQHRSNTCWSFATTSLLESQLLKNKRATFDLSEMYTVRNMYIEKARTYLLRQGKIQFSEGGLGHDVIRSVARYGAMPESAYPGLKNGESVYEHGPLLKALRKYLDSCMKTRSKVISADWLTGYKSILDEYMGKVPEGFIYNGKRYTPEKYASEALGFNESDFVNLTSFTHQPYYKPFVLDVPDNFSNGQYYNLPLKEMIEVVKAAVQGGHTVMWDADVSNPGFRSKAGMAVLLPETSTLPDDSLRADMPEERWDEKIRQQLYETLVTQDDHLMHIIGMQKSPGGKLFFIVKNSWGAEGANKGYVFVSESYFAVNTISLVVPKAAIAKAMLDKLKIQ